MPRMATTPMGARDLALAYLIAKQRVIDSGYALEIDWQATRDFERLTETELLREAAWVVLSSGFRESVVRRIFPRISVAFLRWSRADEISRQIRRCKKAALAIFGHRQKIDAIATIVCRVAQEGFQGVKKRIQLNGVTYIQEWPFMGATTSLHLAKNLGLSVVKPDRHLMRVANAAGYSAPDEMCRAIASVVDDSVAVIDLVIWRYATIEPGYLVDFSACRSPGKHVAA